MLKPTALAFALLPAPVLAQDVVVFAAASLKGPLDAFAESFEAETGHEVVISYAGSNALAKQIIEGAPADIFISAAVNWMDAVEAEGLVSNRVDLLGNRLVLISKGQEIALADLPQALGDGKLAMALVNAVPAGQYGKAAFERLGLWSALEASVAQSDNVRATLALVAAGEAPFGVVYATDAKAEPEVTVAATFPAQSYPPIFYPAALLKEADEAGDQFYKALRGPIAKGLFQDAGFTILE